MKSVKKKRRKYRQNLIERLFMDHRFFTGIVVVWLLVFVRLFAPVVEKKRDLQREIDIVEHDVYETQERVLQLKDTISNLESDPEYIEKMARDRLGMTREDEVVYAIVDKFVA